MHRKRLGQHFLFDPAILGRIIRAAELEAEDTVVEIGPGPGALTLMLAERAEKVIAIELDRDLYERLREIVPGNVELVLGDALKYPYEKLGPFKVVANIPYQITTPLIFRLFEQRGRLRSMTLTIQKEVAERLAASPGSKDYGVLSIMARYYGRTRLEFPISRQAFRPPPRVDSACVRIDVLERPDVTVRDEGLFFQVVKKAFSHRRKTMLNALKEAHPDIRKILLDAGIEPSRRPETLSIEEFARISDSYDLCHGDFSAGDVG